MPRDHDPYGDGYQEPYHRDPYDYRYGEPYGQEPPAYTPSPSYPAPRFYDPSMRGRYDPGLPDLDDDYDAPRPRWRRRVALTAIGGGAIALVGGGAYAVNKFLAAGQAQSPRRTAAGDNPQPQQYSDQNESYMGSEAGLGVRKNTPSTGRLFGTPAEAAQNTLVSANTVLPKKDPVRHLASRMTFGPTPKVISDITKLGINAWIQQQLKPDAIPPSRGEQKLSELATFNLVTPQQLRDASKTLDAKGAKADEENIKATVARQIWSDRQLFEAMVDYWNDFLHVAAFHDNNELYRASFDPDVIRKYALADYPSMFLAAQKHPAMLIYLDQPQSTKTDINENLARENLELFSVGVDGGYTETDVRQAAILQTGRSVRNDMFVFVPSQHATGPVKIMGFTNANATPEGGEAAQEAYFKYLAMHPSTARYIARTMATRFVSDTPPKTIVDRMAAAYLKNKGQIVPVIMTMLSSSEFWASVGQKVRRPLEYVTATYRALGVQPDAPAGFTSNNQNMTPFVQVLGDLTRKLQQMGQAPMDRPTPDGYPDVYPAWTSAGTMITAWNEALDAINGARRALTSMKPEQLVTSPPATADKYLDALTRRLVNATFTAKQKAPLLALAGVQASSPVDATFNGAIAAVARAILASPFHHLR
jgi:uncharacterized protein (DUF1800 family)